MQQVADDGLAGQQGAVVALDPRTGAMLALASSPTFDLNRWLTDFPAIPDERAPLLNRATLGRYPPARRLRW